MQHSKTKQTLIASWRSATVFEIRTVLLGVDLGALDGHEELESPRISQLKICLSAPNVVDLRRNVNTFYNLIHQEARGSNIKN